MNVYICCIVCVVSLAGILFGYGTGVISGALLFMEHEFHLSAETSGIVVGAILLGGCFGALLSGPLVQRFGHKKLLACAALFFIFGSLETACASSVLSLIVGRLLAGVSIGMGSYISPLYVSEISSPQQRGVLVSFSQLAVSIGILIAYLINYFFAPTAAWNWMIGVGSIPAFLLFVGTFFIPDSPRWLMQRGKEQAARHVLQKLRPSCSVEDECDEIRKARGEMMNQRGPSIFSKAIRPVLLIGIGLAIVQQATGINTIFYYVPSILKLAGLGMESIGILATVGIGTFFLVCTFVSIFLIHAFGRRVLLLAGLTGMILGLMGFTWSFHGSHVESSGSFVLVVSLLIYSASFAFSLGPVTWLMISEIFPSKVKGRCAGFVTSVLWLANFFVATSFLKCVETLGTSGTFSLYMALSVLSFCFVYFCVPETKGISLEQIEAQRIMEKS